MNADRKSPGMYEGMESESKASDKSQGRRGLKSR